MAASKIKSENYLTYLHTKSCSVCGVRKIEAHHESLHPRFRASKKKHCDLTALPLCTEHHLERHAIGRKDFWNKYRRNPYKLSVLLLRDYKEEMHPKEFGGEEAYDEEMELVEDLIEVLKSIASI